MRPSPGTEDLRRFLLRRSAAARPRSPEEAARPSRSAVLLAAGCVSLTFSFEHRANGLQRLCGLRHAAYVATQTSRDLLKECAVDFADPLPRETSFGRKLQ